jgi:thioredoxin 1
MACRAAATELEVLTQEVAAAPGVTELTIETWEAFMDNAGQHHVLVDFYTDWCGPCKLISPELEKFSQQYQVRCR